MMLSRRKKKKISKEQNAMDHVAVHKHSDVLPKAGLLWALCTLRDRGRGRPLQYRKLPLSLHVHCQSPKPGQNC